MGHSASLSKRLQCVFGVANGLARTANSLSGTSEKVKPENQDHNGGSTKNQDMCKRPGKRKASTQDIARNYLKSMKVIGQKTNVKMYFVLILRL